MNAVIHPAGAGSVAPRTPSRPWILALVAAMYGVYLGLTIYADWHTLEPLNAAFDVTAAGFVLDHVAQGSPASRAGLRDGDLLTTIDGHKAHSVLAWTSAVARLTPEHPIQVVYERNGTPHDASLAFNRRSEPLWSTLSGSILIL